MKLPLRSRLALSFVAAVALVFVLLGLYLHHAGLLKGDQRGAAAVGLAATGLLLAPIVVVGAAYLLLSGAGGPRP